jgi:hypothetical protein
MLMKIVVCDDCVEDLQYIEGLLQKYTKSASSAGLVVDKYIDAATLYDRIQEGERAEIYILDMIMCLDVTDDTRIITYIPNLHVSTRFLM